MDRSLLRSRFLLLEVATICQWSKSSQQLFPCNGLFSIRRQSSPLVRLIKTYKSCADSLLWPLEELFEICPMKLPLCASELIYRKASTAAPVASAREVAKMYGLSERSLWRNLWWAAELKEVRAG